MSRVISVRLDDETLARLERLAKGGQWSLGKAARILLDEKLAEEEHPLIEFRATAAGRLPYVKRTRLAVWLVVLVARACDMDPARVAKHLGQPEKGIRAALTYAEEHPEEVERAVEAEDVDFEDLERSIPGIREFRI